SVAMGMGRFFYTPALPLMVAALHWGAGPGSWIATLNYVGYFIGSLVVARGWIEPNRAVYRLSLIVSTLGLAAVALTPNLIWQGSIRTLAGIASGLIFVCVTQRIPANSRTPRDGGISYGGWASASASPEPSSSSPAASPTGGSCASSARPCPPSSRSSRGPGRSRPGSHPTPPPPRRPTRPRSTPPAPPPRRSLLSTPTVAAPWPSCRSATSSKAAATSSSARILGCSPSPSSATLRPRRRGSARDWPPPRPH